MYDIIHKNNGFDEEWRKIMPFREMAKGEMPSGTDYVLVASELRGRTSKFD